MGLTNCPPRELVAVVVPARYSLKRRAGCCHGVGVSWCQLEGIPLNEGVQGEDNKKSCRGVEI